MERGLDGELEPPAWPDGLDPRAFAVEDAEAVFAAQERHSPTTGASSRGRSSRGARTTWPSRGSVPLADRLGRRRDRGSLRQPAARGEDTTVGWVGSLAVRRPWRRRGLGEALLRDAFLRFAERGKRSAGLGVDAENTTGAVALYERVGMHVVRRSDTWERTA